MSKNKFFKIYVIILLLIVFVSIGYSAFEQKYNIENTKAEIRVNKDIRITDVSIDSVINEGISNYDRERKDSRSITSGV